MPAKRPSLIALMLILLGAFLLVRIGPPCAAQTMPVSVATAQMDMACHDIAPADKAGYDRPAQPGQDLEPFCVAGCLVTETPGTLLAQPAPSVQLHGLSRVSSLSDRTTAPTPPPPRAAIA